MQRNILMVERNQTGCWDCLYHFQCHCHWMETKKRKDQRKGRTNNFHITVIVDIFHRRVVYAVS